jgi:hypothetical protein
MKVGTGPMPRKEGTCLQTKGGFSMNASDANARFTFFFPGARILSDQERASLPEEKKQAAAEAGKEGVWLEVDCPDRSCIEEGKIVIPAAATAAEGEGYWLNLFCPENSCKISEMTDLP